MSQIEQTDAGGLEHARQPGTGSGTGDETAAGAPSAPVREARSDLRSSRLDELAEASLAKLDPLDANIAMINWELLSMASELGPAILEAMRDSVQETDSSKSAAARLNDYLRILKQVERFTEFEARKDREARRAAAKECGQFLPR